MTATLSRRAFLKTASATSAAAFVIGFGPEKALATAGSTSEFTPFIRVATDGKVTAIIKHFECGQGAATGLATLIAEELNMPLSEVEIEFAPADGERYANLLYRSQSTGGSTSMANSFMQYRTAGAAAREMLVSAAAQQWGVEADTVTLKDCKLTSGNHSAHISEFAATAATIEVPSEPKLKDPSEFSVIGNPETGRRDNGPKTNGTAQYAMDVHLDGQIVAVILRSPRFGGKIVSMDDSAARDVPGFIRAAQIPTGAGVVVYASNTWAAFQSRDAITAEWDFSAADNRSSDQIRADLLAAGERRSGI